MVRWCLGGDSDGVVQGWGWGSGGGFSLDYSTDLLQKTLAASYCMMIPWIVLFS